MFRKPYFKMKLFKPMLQLSHVCDIYADISPKASKHTGKAGRESPKPRLLNHGRTLKMMMLAIIDK